VAVDDPASIARGMQRILEPERNASIRERVRAFSARETWEREREILARVYRGLEPDEQRRMTDTYAGYAESEHKRRSWDAANPGNAAIREELVQAVRSLAGERLRGARAILDVGCGTGWWLERIARQLAPGAELHGVDLLPERVSAARERVPSATVEVADARRLPFDDASFEAVSMFTVLSSLQDRDDVADALAEARRVLAPGGVILIWEPRIPNPLNRNTLLVDRRLLRHALPDLTLEVRSLTLLPPLARRLGPGAYHRLARVPALHTHRLVCARA
jgi:SAM-dependent methyltransferase